MIICLKNVSISPEECSIDEKIPHFVMVLNKEMNYGKYGCTSLC
jgi:hypothetical protein